MALLKTCVVPSMALVPACPVVPAPLNPMLPKPATFCPHYILASASSLARTHCPSFEVNSFQGLLIFFSSRKLESEFLI